MDVSFYWFSVAVLVTCFLLIVEDLLILINRVRGAPILKELKKNKSFGKLYDYAKKLKIKVVIDISHERSFYQQSLIKIFWFGKLMPLSKPFIVLGVKYRRNSESLAISLAHELGHRLFYLSQISKYQTYPETPDIFCPIKNMPCEVVEELGAQRYALLILNELGIKFNREKFLKISSFYFGTYLLDNLNCLNQNCPKSFLILCDELTKESISLSPEEQKYVAEFYTGISEVMRLPDLGRIFED
ncbi:hypothetical protein M1513_00795 [Patescibacteria group bacterium]|nr:hypothetical protein [Patescibacteria group bacterium]